jgi:nucleotide-binding universal stress UspA family protein
MFKKILVPLDGSEYAEKIGGFVAGLARPLGAEIVLLAVVDPAEIRLPEAMAAPGHPVPGHAPYDKPGYEHPAPGISSRGGKPEVSPGFGTQVVDRAVEFARNYLAREVERLDASGVPATSHVAVGQPADEIVRYAREAHVDMIAMATHRESALARGVLGSITDRVLHSSSVPVLAVHPKSASAFAGNAGAPNVIIVPLDGSPLSEAAVPVALDIAEACASDVVFIMAVRFPYYGVSGPGIEYYAGDYGIAEQRREALEYLSRFVQMAESKGLKARAHAAIGNAAFRIIEEAESLQGAMIVMTTHGSGGFKRWVIGSVTDKVVRSAGMPVLVLPPKVEAPVFDRPAASVPATVGGRGR